LLICAGAGTAAQTIETQTVTVEIRPSLPGVPVTGATISLPSNEGPYHDVQVAMGYVWATTTGKKTFRIDPESFQVDELPRPRALRGLKRSLIAEHSMWYSNGIPEFGPASGRLDLYRVDPDTNEVTATITGAGAPFATGDGVVWAYNSRTGVVSEIDAQDDQLRTQIHTRASRARDQTHFAFGAGSIWQFAYERDVSVLNLVWRHQYGGEFPVGVLRRIDPGSKDLIAQVVIGPYSPTAQIRFVAESIWVLGRQDSRGPALATRIDATTNQISAVIALAENPRCYSPVVARSLVAWDDAIWVSTGCVMGIGLSIGTTLQRIDPITNSISDEILLYGSGQLWPQSLAAGEGALWALSEYGRLERLEY
jgi:hypothetical protein